MNRHNRQKYRLDDLMGIDRDHRLAQAFLFLANETAQQNKLLEKFLAKHR